MSESISFRPVEPADEEFLVGVYATTRTEELAAVPWSVAEKEAFLRMQFAAQQRHYRENYAGARFDLILLEGRPVGRLYVARWAREIRIMDIGLLPEARNRGIGSGILKDLLEEGRRSARLVSIHVERFNPALRLYERLGFRAVAERGVYLQMEWSPTATHGDPP